MIEDSVRYEAVIDAIKSLKKNKIKFLNDISISHLESWLKESKKQGALEELYSLLYYCGKAQVGEEAIKRKISKRIKELEKREVKK